MQDGRECERGRKVLNSMSSLVIVRVQALQKLVNSLVVRWPLTLCQASSPFFIYKLALSFLVTVGS